MTAKSLMNNFFKLSNNASAPEIANLLWSKRPPQNPLEKQGGFAPTFSSFDAGPPQVRAGSLRFCWSSGLLVVLLELLAGCLTLPALF